MAAQRCDVRQRLHICEVRMDDELSVVLADGGEPVVEVRFQAVDPDVTRHHEAQLLSWWLEQATVADVRTGDEVALVDELALLRRAFA